MAITFVGKGAIQTGTGAGLALSSWASVTTDDIEIGIVQTANQSIALNTANGWAAISGGSVGIGTAGVDGAALYLFWRRNAGESNGTLTDSGDHQFSRVLTFRGCIATGDPWEAIQTSTQTSATTSGSATGLTTLTDGAMLCVITTQLSGTDGAEFSSWTNGDLASITEETDDYKTHGIGGCFGSAYGIRTTAGAVGATTFTTAASATKAHIVLALKEPAAAGGGLLPQMIRHYY